MPKKIEVQMPEPATEPPVAKPKREITEAQREHLNKIRQLALDKKKQLKEITLKAKLAKTVPKEDLAKQYDDYVAKKVTQASASEPKKPKPKQQVKRFDNSESETDETIESEEEFIVQKKIKPVKKIKKKIVYESESEEEQIVVRKKKPIQKAYTNKPQKLENLVYKNTQEQLYNRMIEERVKNSLMGYSNSLGV